MGNAAGGHGLLRPATTTVCPRGAGVNDPGGAACHPIPKAVGWNFGGLVRWGAKFCQSLFSSVTLGSVVGLRSNEVPDESPTEGSL